MIVALILYAIGCFCMAVAFGFFVCLGGRNPRPMEWLAGIVAILCWPVALPLFFLSFRKW